MQKSENKESRRNMIKKGAVALATLPLLGATKEIGQKVEEPRNTYELGHFVMGDTVEFMEYYVMNVYASTTNPISPNIYINPLAGGTKIYKAEKKRGTITKVYEYGQDCPVDVSPSKQYAAYITTKRDFLNADWRKSKMYNIRLYTDVMCFCTMHVMAFQIIRKIL